MHLFLLYVCKTALSIFYLYRNQQNGRDWFKRELEKGMITDFLHGFSGFDSEIYRDKFSFVKEAD